MARSDFRLVHSIRVRYAEVDAQAVVFNSRYLEYLDVGVSEYWRAAGLLPDAFDVRLVRHVIDYAKPLRYDELFDIGVRMSRIGRTSLTLAWEIHGHGADDLRAGGESVSVHVDLESGRPLPVPDHIYSLFEAYEGRSLRTEKAA